MKKMDKNINTIISNIVLISFIILIVSFKLLKISII